MAAASGRVRQVEQRLSALSTLGLDRRLGRGSANSVGVGAAGSSAAHDRQYHRPGASERRRRKRGNQNAEALGRSRGGFSTKIHARCDGKGRPLGFILTGGEIHDGQAFLALFRLLEDKIKAMIADKGYDADAIREELLFHGVEPVIPSKINRRETIPYDRDAYRERNLIERLFNKLKNWRRIATRFDKTAVSFLSFIQIISAKFWIPFVNRT
jgi:transposase